MQNTQVIAVGRAFEGLENVHRIELTQVWSQMSSSESIVALNV